MGVGQVHGGLTLIKLQVQDRCVGGSVPNPNPKIQARSGLIESAIDRVVVHLQCKESITY